MNAPISSPSSSSSTGSLARQSPTGFQQSIPAPPPAQAKASSTDPFLKDLNLVAEAVKRAQVAVMVRDFESCGLS